MTTVKYCQACGLVMNRRQAGAKLNKRRDSPVICRGCTDRGVRFGHGGTLVKKGKAIK